MRKSVLACLIAVSLIQWQPVALAASPLQISGVIFDNAVTPSALAVAQITTNDPLFNQQIALRQIGVPQAWSITTGGTAPVAVIDTGIDLQHEDLVNKLWINSDEIPNNWVDDDGNGYIDDYQGYNFLDHNSNIADTHGHGTGIASIIAAQTNNGLGMAGISWSSPIMVLKALNSLGGGDFSTVAEAIRYAANNGAKVINMSFGSNDDMGALKDAVNEAISKNVIIVAAVGNNRSANIFYPAAYPNVIAVSSINDSGQLSSFCNYGFGVDIAAPGENVLMAGSSANSLSRYVTGSGSSFAAAEVSGTVALLLARNPNLTVSQVTNIISATADVLPNDPAKEYFGAGRINAGQALAYQSQSLTATINLSNSQPFADGLTTTIITATITNDFGQLQTNLPITLKLSGNSNIVNNQLAIDGGVMLKGTTDASGQVNFAVASSFAETKSITLSSGANLISLQGRTTIAFKPLARPHRTMQWLGQSPSIAMNLGDTTNLWVDIKNTGNVAWVSDPQATSVKGILRLGTSRPLDRSSSFYDSQTWSATNRSAYLTPNIVKPGQVGRFNFTLRANQAGKFREYFRPVIDYVGWLNDLGIYWDINVNNQNISGFGIFNLLASTNPSDYSADIRGKTNDLTLAPGQSVGLWVDLINTGSAAWMNNGKDLKGTGAVRLGTVSPRDRTSAFYTSTWQSPNRVVGPSFMVPPNAAMELVFDIKAPMTKGIYQENFQLVSEYVTWFGPIFGWKITVT